MKTKRTVGQVAADVRKCVKRYSTGSGDDVEHWREIDGVIRAIFRSFPEHWSKNQVYLKVVAVDRLYKAWLYRQGPDVVESVVTGLHGSRKKIDERLAALRRPVTSGKLVRMNELAAIVAGAGDPADPRFWVFASKYLHFHKPRVFPIMDGYAEDELWSLVGELELTVESDGLGRYGEFCAGILALDKRIRAKTKHKFSWADYDKYLYGRRYLEQ